MHQVVKIYVPLLDEGLEVFRPTQALKITENIYKILPCDNYDPDDEVWKFPPESVVKAEIIVSDKGLKFLAAVDMA